MGSIIWDLPFSLMLGLKFVSNLIHTLTASDLLTETKTYCGITFLLDKKIEVISSL